MRGPFTPQPGQSLEDQVAELGLLVNRLREELLAQDQEHRRAIEAVRERVERDLRAERDRSDSVLRAFREELEGLRETTTGGMRLRIEGVLVLLVGVIFTTWPDDVADWLPSWPPFRVAMFFLGAYLYARLFWALWLRPRESQTASH
jgi:hypothetical protein